MPVRISLNEPKKVSFQAKATMKRNRWINFSVRCSRCRLRDAARLIAGRLPRWQVHGQSSLLLTAAITIIATSLAGCSSSKKAGHQQAGEPIPTDAEFRKAFGEVEFVVLVDGMD